jgi:lysyl-tRNA synthetase class 1
VVRYMFASTRPNAEFAISFDLDVIKIYEDYDRCERICFGQEQVSEDRAARERRIYELSQVRAVPQAPPVQVPFRHLCNLVQIHDGQVDPVLDRLELTCGSEDRRRVAVRTACAANWIRLYAPESFRFSVRAAGSPAVEVDDKERKALRLLRQELEQPLQAHDDKSLGERIYALAAEAGLDPKELFKVVYRVLIGKEAGPRLASFLLTLDRERVLALLQDY